MWQAIERGIDTVFRWIFRGARRYGSRVDAVFTLLKCVVPVTAVDAAWLAQVRLSAIQGRPEWKLRLDAYLHGLEIGKAERADAIALVRTALAECPEPGVPRIFMVLPILWAVAASIPSVGLLVITWGRTLYWMWIPLVFLVGAIAAGQIPSFSPAFSFRLSRFGRSVLIWAYAAYVLVAVFVASSVTSEIMQARSQFRFNEARKLLNDDPRGFPMLRAFARENYGVEVVLGDRDSGWAQTEMQIPGASVATMSLGSGYCEMNMNRQRIMREFGPVQANDPTLWIQGVMMHEFAHCLDAYRDMPSFNGRPPSTFALSPADAGDVTDARTYIAATRKGSTVLWREALGDIFAIGFWRLAASPGQADLLAARLRAKRAEDAGTDKGHATMCWIDMAVRASLPASNKDLLRWADEIRSSSACSTRIM